MMSGIPREQLPSSIRDHGAKKLCEVSSILKDRDVEMKLKNRHWYSRGDKYWRFRFDVKIIVGAADLKFLLLTKDKRVISNHHEAIKIKWEASR